MAMSVCSGFPPVVKVTEYQKLLKSAPNNLTIIAYCKSNHLLILQLQAKRKIHILMEDACLN
jgi:hypothetical protein